MDETKQAVLDGLNARLDAMVATVVEELNKSGRDFAHYALGVFLITATSDELTDLAFGAILRLVEQEVANSE